MKTVLGCLRKADKDFHMIAPGDKIAVGVSGGKDSLLLLNALALYKKFSHVDYTLHAFTMSMGLEPFDTTGVESLCNAFEVPFTRKDTEIAHILFDIRKEKNPCALCAKMRRGVLNDLAVEYGCNKLALGHHREDALETLLMSLLYEARLHTFHPVTYLSRCDITVIRPLIYLPEAHVIQMAQKLKLPIIKSPCPHDGHTKRQEMKDLLADLTKRYPEAKEYMLSALRNDEQYGLWEKS
jgi:Predicted ATPase of the PP-loop superfamily implicated in cell cycle control